MAAAGLPEIGGVLREAAWEPSSEMFVTAFA